MQIQVNGKPQTLPSRQTISELLGCLELDAARVVVERNRQIVPREQLAATALEEGDQLEILQFVGGG